MLKVGDRVRITKNREGKNTYAIETNKRVTTIYYLDKHKITVQYEKDGQPTSRESFNKADIIENIAIIEVKKGKEWTRITKEYFR